ncbi:MAG: hypothetical protein ABI627_12400 [Polyangiaceae bacterium]
MVRSILSAASLALAIGCGGKAEGTAGAGGDGAGGVGSTSAGASAGGASGAASAETSGNGQGGAPCSIPCPTPFVEIRLEITADGGGPVSAAQATLISNDAPGSQVVTIKMSCSTDVTRTVCVPQTGGALGEYLVEVTAPGFQELVVAARVVSPPPTGCGCETAILQPSMVTLKRQF